jgi:hypothetical protein
VDWPRPADRQAWALAFRKDVPGRITWGEPIGYRHIRRRSEITSFAKKLARRENIRVIERVWQPDMHRLPAPGMANPEHLMLCLCLKTSPPL